MNKKFFQTFLIVVIILLTLNIFLKLYKNVKDEYFRQGAFWAWSTIEENHYYPAPFEITYRATLLNYNKYSAQRINK